MRRHFPFEFVYQVFALLIAAIVVHAVYTAVVRPKARAVLDAIKTASQAGTGERVDTSPNFYVIIQDPEQELSIIFAIWSIAIMGYKFRTVGRERDLIQSDLVRLTEGESILPEDARTHARGIEALPDESRARLVPQLYLAALNRFRITRSVQDASDEARRVADSVNDRLDAELALIRYIAWAIPSIGFVGTVRGIGDSLGHAQAVLQG
ncbi:MAG TPA: hypothetical protein VJM11_08915, partial [Nevskiaceae bacterium]|nr:hypothetical protein [Nevskiaceae bacterium]